MSLPNVPSSSPPPIAPSVTDIPVGLDFEDVLGGICDSGDNYDITGLSQKFNIGGDDHASFQEEPPNLNEIADDMNTCDLHSCGDNLRLSCQQNEALSDERDLVPESVDGEMRSQNLTSGYMISPPPLNVIASVIDFNDSNICTGSEEHLETTGTHSVMNYSTKCNSEANVGNKFNILDNNKLASSNVSTSKEGCFNANESPGRCKELEHLCRDSEEILHTNDFVDVSCEIRQSGKTTITHTQTLHSHFPSQELNGTKNMENAQKIQSKISSLSPKNIVCSLENRQTNDLEEPTLKSVDEGGCSNPENNVPVNSFSTNNSALREDICSHNPESVSDTHIDCTEDVGRNELNSFQNTTECSLEGSESDFGDFCCGLETGQMENEDEFGDFITSQNSEKTGQHEGTDNEPHFGKSTPILLQSKESSSKSSEDLALDNSNIGSAVNVKEKEDYFDDGYEFRNLELNDMQDDDGFGDFNYAECSKGLQLEFSDDEDDKFQRKEDSPDVEKDISCISKGNTESNISNDKFKSQLLNWIPFASSASISATRISCNGMKLNELLEEDTFIWHHLSNMDSTVAIKLSWPDSNANKLFLSSLNVDARNILFGHKWSSTIPLFAQTLSFSPLTPAKPSSSSKAWNIAGKGLDPESISPPYDTKTAANLKTSIESEPKTIPPVQFDWSSSGLKNPFDVQGLQSEIFGSTMKNANPSTDRGPPQRTSPLLDKIMKESTSGPSTSTNLETLSPDVREAVLSLPNLNFMTSKVLMFPIQEGSYIS